MFAGALAAPTHLWQLMEKLLAALFCASDADGPEKTDHSLLGLAALQCASSVLASVGQDALSKEYLKERPISPLSLPPLAFHSSSLLSSASQLSHLLRLLGLFSFHCLCSPYPFVLSLLPPQWSYMFIDSLIFAPLPSTSLIRLTEHRTGNTQMPSETPTKAQEGTMWEIAQACLPRLSCSSAVESKQFRLLAVWLLKLLDLKQYCFSKGKQSPCMFSFSSQPTTRRYKRECVAVAAEPTMLHISSVSPHLEIVFLWRILLSTLTLSELTIKLEVVAKSLCEFSSLHCSFSPSSSTTSIPRPRSSCHTTLRTLTTFTAGLYLELSLTCVLLLLARPTSFQICNSSRSPFTTLVVVLSLAAHLLTSASRGLGAARPNAARRGGHRQRAPSATQPGLLLASLPQHVRRLAQLLILASEMISKVLQECCERAASPANQDLCSFSSPRDKEGKQSSSPVLESTALLLTEPFRLAFLYVDAAQGFIDAVKAVEKRKQILVVLPKVVSKMEQFTSRLLELSIIYHIPNRDLLDKAIVMPTQSDRRAGSERCNTCRRS